MKKQILMSRISIFIMLVGIVVLFSGCIRTPYELYHEDDMIESYRIVTTVRANSLKRLISIESPLGRALMGKHVGDRVEVQVNPSYSYYVVIKNIEKIDDDSEDRIRSY